MLLTEIIKDLTVRAQIKPGDPMDLVKTFDVGGEQIKGIDCISRLISETISKAYKFSVVKVHLAQESVDFSSGPERMLKLEYRTKVINEIASKYRFLTSDMDFTNFEVWNSELKSNIFKNIIENPVTLSKLRNVDLSQYIPEISKKNDNQTMTSYNYEFYDTEKPDWADSRRLKGISFENGYLIVELDMPVKEVPVVKAE